MAKNKMLIYLFISSLFLISVETEHRPNLDVYSGIKTVMFWPSKIFTWFFASRKLILQVLMIYEVMWD